MNSNYSHELRGRHQGNNNNNTYGGSDGHTPPTHGTLDMYNNPVVLGPPGSMGSLGYVGSGAGGAPLVADPVAKKSPSKLSTAWNKGSLKPARVGWEFLRRRTHLTVWIFVGMIIGIIVGHTAPDFSVQIGPLGNVFLRMIQCVIGPLIFSTLVIGIAGQGEDLTRIARLALKSAIYFIVVSALALIIGIIAVNVAKPGANADFKRNTAPGASPTPVISTNVTAITWVNEMEAIVPTSFFLALTDHSAVLAIVFCAIMFSVALTQVNETSRKFMLDFNVSISTILFKVVEMIMNYAPIGVGCAIAYTVGRYGISSLATTGLLVATLIVALLLLILLVYVPILYFCGVPWKEFPRAVAQPVILAFATSSSESALPKALEKMVEFGVPLETAAFVLPTGYSFNLAGSTLYLAIATMFCAQVADVTKSIGEQTVILLTLMLTSKGMAAVPRASFIVLAMTLNNAKIPADGLALIMSVDAFMDMLRTAVNILGNMLASVAMAKWEGEFRNAEWRRSQEGQQTEKLGMDDDEEAPVALLPLHHAPVPHFGVPSSSNAIHSGAISAPVTVPIYVGDKTSIHSVESIRSSFNGRYDH